MLKAYKYRIYPDKVQEELLAKTFGCCRFVYNQLLAYRKEKYEKEKKSISRTDCNRNLKAEKKTGLDFGIKDLCITTDNG